MGGDVGLLCMGPNRLFHVINRTPLSGLACLAVQNDIIFWGENWAFFLVQTPPFHCSDRVLRLNSTLMALASISSPGDSC